MKDNGNTILRSRYHLDYPLTVAEAEHMEEYNGGMNAFVHISMPDEVLVDIEENKMKCTTCDKNQYREDIVNAEHGIRIDSECPKDPFCSGC